MLLLLVSSWIYIFSKENKNNGIFIFPYDHSSSSYHFILCNMFRKQIFDGYSKPRFIIYTIGHKYYFSFYDLPSIHLLWNLNHTNYISTPHWNRKSTEQEDDAQKENTSEDEVSNKVCWCKIVKIIFRGH